MLKKRQKKVMNSTFIAVAASINSILLLSPIAFSIILAICLVVLSIKFIQTTRLKKQQSMRLTSGEKWAFGRKAVFIFMAFPLVILSAIAQSAFIALLVQASNVVGYLVSLNTTFIFSFACSFYISLLMLYISFLLLSTLKQIERISRFEFVAWNVIIVASLTAYFVSCVAAIIVSGLSASTVKVPGFTRDDRNIFKSFALGVNYVTFWISYWIFTLVLIIGIRFYLLIISYSKKIANQMIVFLSMLIVAALVQSFAALLPSFSLISDVFIIIALWIQRISEIFFMTAFLLMYLPLQSVGELTIKIGKEVLATVEKLGQINKAYKEMDASPTTPTTQSLSDSSASPSRKSLIF